MPHSWPSVKSRFDACWSSVLICWFLVNRSNKKKNLPKPIATRKADFLCTRKKKLVLHMHRSYHRVFSPHFLCSQQIRLQFVPWAVYFLQRSTSIQLAKQQTILEILLWVIYVRIAPVVRNTRTHTTSCHCANLTEHITGQGFQKAFINVF